MDQANALKIAAVIVGIILISYFLKINCLVHKLLPQDWRRPCGSGKEHMLGQVDVSHPFGGNGQTGCICPHLVMSNRGHYINPYTYV